MIRVVQKFGGTSVADVSCIKNAAKRISAEVDAGNQVAVVVSAMAGVTDQLIEWVSQTCPFHNGVEHDVVVSSGEQITSGLLALALQNLGISARSWLSWQIPIMSDKTHRKARIHHISTQHLEKALNNGQVAIVPGFQGVNAEQQITTLGRGGSDTTAVALAAALKADRCDIFTDVEGVYTADPKIVKKARKLDKINYEEMLELSSQGAKVLQTRSVEMARRYEVKLRVLSSFLEVPGTMVIKGNEVEEESIAGITYSRDEAELALWGIPKDPTVVAEIFDLLRASDIHIDMSFHSASLEEDPSFLAFMVPKAEVGKAQYLLEEAQARLNFDRLKLTKDIVKISIIGAAIKRHAGAIPLMFKTLAKHGIFIKAMTTTEIKISIVIAEEYTELAVRALHTAYGLDVH